MFWQKWFNLTPQFVAYQFPGHLLHPHWYFTAYSSICQVLLGALSGFRRRRTAGPRFLALVGFLTSGHFVPNRGRSLLTGRLVNLRRAACAGLRRFRLFLHSRPGLLFRRTAPALRRLIRLRRFLFRGRSLLRQPQSLLFLRLHAPPHVSEP